MKLFRRAERERERADEMQAHQDLYADELIARGYTPDAARREARLKFGNPRAKLEEIGDQQRLPLFDTLGRDLRYAVRVLARTPAFTITTIVTLALVIGANGAVFSLADTLLLRALPYPEPDRLVYVHTTRDGQFTSIGQDGNGWEAIRDRVPSLTPAVYAGIGGGVNLVAPSGASYVRFQRVSASYFRVLGVLPRYGREFTPEEDAPNGPPAAILSHALWQRLFAGDVNAVGQRIQLRGEPHTVVGVMPAEFVNIWDVDLWTPLRPSRMGEGGGTNYVIIARLNPGVTTARAEGELRAASTPEIFVGRHRKGSDFTYVFGMTPMHDQQTTDLGQPIVLLGASVGVVLLIACVNLAALLLARGGGRAKEIATRMALGSGRRAVVRQLMVEAVVLAVAGGLLGILVAQFALASLKWLAVGTFGDWQRVSLDARVIGATLGLGVLTSIVFGLVPAWQASRVDVRAALADAGSRAVAGGARHWPRRVLVAAEVALSVALLVTASLLIRTFVSLRNLDPGFDPANLATVSVSLQDARYGTVDSVARLVDVTLEQLRSTPGIESAAVALGSPYERLLNMSFLWQGAKPEDGQMANVGYVSDRYFDTLRVPIRIGRPLLDSDRGGTPPVIVVNESFARLYSKDQPVLGRRLRLSGVEREIVGIAGDVRQRFAGFVVDGLETGPLVNTPIIYLPVGQANDGLLRQVHVWFRPVWTVRSSAPGRAEQAMREAIASADAALPVAESATMSGVMSRAIAQQRLLMTLVAVLAAAALLLAAIGIQGLMAHTVAERRREIGIRLALGATPAQTVREIAISGLALTLAGVIAGAALSVLAVRLVQSFLWGTGTTDPMTYVAVAVVLFAVAGLASVLPALRILRLDPAVTLRQ
jgi:predicted permease